MTIRMIVIIYIYSLKFSDSWIMPICFGPAKSKVLKAPGKEVLVIGFGATKEEGISRYLRETTMKVD